MSHAQDFDRMISASAEPVLVDFHAQWCPPCKMLGPVIDQLASDLAGQLRVAKVDIDQAPELAARYQVSSVPTLILFRDGQPVARSTGFRPAPALKAWTLQHTA